MTERKNPRTKYPKPQSKYKIVRHPDEDFVVVSLIVYDEIGFRDCECEAFHVNQLDGHDDDPYLGKRIVRAIAFAECGR